MSDYTEDSLVEKPAIEVFRSLGYEFRNCFYEKVGDVSSTLGRRTTNEVVLVPRLKDALFRLNPDLPSEAIDQAVEDLTKDRSTLSMVNANREIYKLLKDGVKVTIETPEGERKDERVKVIDFNCIENNDFFLASQLWISGEVYKRRTDLVGFVNGLPLIFIELKAIHRRLENAYKNNLTDYKDNIPHLFWYNAFIILSNATDSKIGTLTSPYELFTDWKKINSEGEEGIVSLDTMLRGTCEKGKFMDLFENFVLFTDEGGPLIKMIARNHQYLGVNNVVEAVKKIKEKKGRLGVFWHTQGSGKSYSMIFLSQKVLRKFSGNHTFVIVTDRIDLDDQIYEKFQCAGAVTEARVQAENGEHLKHLLQEDHRQIFTLIQKFGTKKGQKYPKLSDRSDIIVMTDEAHRSQYDTLALNMRTALPNAAFIAFTGTPLMVGERKTKDTFGDYVSIYNFTQSTDDHNTVPLFYENRIPKVELTNEELNEDMLERIEEADLDESQEIELEKEFGREYHIITRDDRLEEIAKDIVIHFMNRGHMGKAMVMSVDKTTAVRMYDKVQKYWRYYLDVLQEELKTASEEDKAILQNKIEFMQKTDMAVVVSGEQNEVEKFELKGLDILPHRIRMNKEDMAKKFKDAKDLFRIVFLCRKWMEGFDVHSLSTIYLDKPMQNHSLMQAITRANRVFGEKQNGLIVDYIGLFRNLKKALAIYGSSSGGGVKPGDSPVSPKEKLVELLREAENEVTSYLQEKNIEPDKIFASEGFAKAKLLKDAVDAVVENDDTKNTFLSLTGKFIKLYKAVLPHPSANEFTDLKILLGVIVERIGSLSPETDISEAVESIERLLDDSIHTIKYTIKKSFDEDDYMDLSKIDFDALKKHFEEGKKHIEAERMKGAIRRKLIRMVRINRTRMDYYEKFQEMIAEYNAGGSNVEVFFDKLIVFAQELNEEEKRGISENLSEEELAVFDLLYKEDLTEKEKGQVKDAAKHLLQTLKYEKLVLDWRKRQQTRAQVLTAIRDVLDTDLPRSYTPELYNQKCDLVYQHVYDSYGAGVGAH